MTEEQTKLLLPCVYRIYWASDGSSVAAIGVGETGRRWIAPTNWVNGSSTISRVWEDIKRVLVIETQNPDDLTAARLSVEKADAYGKTEPCCECGADYPRADLLDGYIYCLDCRIKSQEQRKR